MLDEEAEVIVVNIFIDMRIKDSYAETLLFL